MGWTFRYTEYDRFYFSTAGFNRSPTLPFFEFRVVNGIGLLIDCHRVEVPARNLHRTFGGRTPAGSGPRTRNVEQHLLRFVFLGDKFNVRIQ
jgi:hypothetical protein